MKMFRFKLQGTDLLISQASWADMGRWCIVIFSQYFSRFICTNIFPGSHVSIFSRLHESIFFQVHMYQYLSRFTCTNICPGSHVRLKMALEWIWCLASSTLSPPPSMTTVNNSSWAEVNLDFIRAQFCSPMLGPDWSSFSLLRLDLCSPMRHLGF